MGVLDPPVTGGVWLEGRAAARLGNEGGGIRRLARTPLRLSAQPAADDAVGEQQLDQPLVVRPGETEPAKTEDRHAEQRGGGEQPGRVKESAKAEHAMLDAAPPCGADGESVAAHQPAFKCLACVQCGGGASPEGLLSAKRPAAGHEDLFCGTTMLRR